jgi:hypothetical protein
MRGPILGVLLAVGLTATILALRPGGIRRQLRFAARRFRIVLVLGGIYVAGSTIIRLAFPQGPVGDFGPPVIAIVLAGAFLVLGRDPATESPAPSLPSRER